MVNTAQLDVLVVYSSANAISASVRNSESRHPFALGSAEEGYNHSYAYFLRACEKAGLTAGFAASSDITGPGTAECYWINQSGNWVKVSTPVQSFIIFDKLSSRLELRVAERELLLSDDQVQAFNNSSIIELFTDKLFTYQQLPETGIPTVAVLSRKAKDITAALTELEVLRSLPRHKGSFSTAVILKDRFGAEGNAVFKIEVPTVSKIQILMRAHPNITFILQPFLLFDSGFSYQEKKTAIDIRLIYHNNQLLQSYLRMAQAGDFRCNAHQGGEVVYIHDDEIPASVLESAQQILQKLDQLKGLFSLDFSISNAGTVYLIEGNSGPGLTWDESMKHDEKKVKQMIRSIVQELAVRAKSV